MEFVKTAKIQIHPQADDIQLLLNSMKAYAKLSQKQALVGARKHKKDR